MSFIRIRLKVNVGRGDLDVGECYDLEDTPALRSLIARGFAELIPYNTDKADGSTPG